MKLSSLTILFSFANCVFGLQNLNFFGEYVVFSPSTTSIKFDLQKDMDILLMDRNVAETAATNYLYRVHMVFKETSNPTVPDSSNQTDNRSYTIDCTVFKEGRIMLGGLYHLWNVTETENIAIDWGSQQNVIQVLTDVDGNQSAIFSWKDRSKRMTRVRHLGVRVAVGNQIENQHAKWKLRVIINFIEADAKDFDVRKAYRMCDINLVAEHPNSKPPPTPIYQIFITRELDERYTISINKNSTEVARTKTSRMYPKNITMSWDYDTGLITLGLLNEPTPLLLWQDMGKKSDLERVKYITYGYKKGYGSPTFYEIKRDTFRTIPEFYPKYFKSSATTNLQSTTKNTSAESTRSMEKIPSDLRDLLYSSEYSSEY